MDRNARPLLIIPPAPARRAALEDFTSELLPAAHADLIRRLGDPPPGSRDAIATMPDGGRSLAVAAIFRRDEVGVLTALTTRSAHRLRGHARRLMQTLLAWFDTTGGRWLFAVAPTQLLPALFEPFGFRVLHRSSADGTDRTSLVRTLGAVGDEPFLRSEASVRLDAVSRADWPLLVGLMQFAAGPDPRVPIDQSAVAAEQAARELLDQLDRGACVLRGSWAGRRLRGVATLAADQLGSRSFGALIPPDAAAALREDLLVQAHARGYAQVDFPFEVLGGTT